MPMSLRSTSGRRRPSISRHSFASRVLCTSAPLQVLRLDAFARIGDGETRVAAGALERELHAAAARRELDRIGEQVPDDLLQARGVAAHHERCRCDERLESHAFRVCRGARPCDRFFDGARELDRLHVEAHLAAEDAVHV